MTKISKTIVILAGPTAVGKTSLSIRVDLFPFPSYPYLHSTLARWVLFCPSFVNRISIDVK
ncbi:MAG: hypothetical protein DSY77_15650 [Bacteroidetes bacterium]|nr:MAG: hypothetical protein DSY77_15650 [Bacteroidota bacterium]